MRIGLVVAGGFDRSGRERVIPSLLWLAERLARIHELHVFVLDYEDEPTTYSLAGATIHDLGRVRAPRGLRRFAIARRLRRALERIRDIDVIHAYWGMPAGIVAVPLARALRIPSVLTLDSGELVGLGAIGYGLQRRWIDRRAVQAVIDAADTITVATHFMARGLGGRNARVIPLGVDRRLFPEASRPDTPPWRLVRVASINRVKDYPTLLGAVAHVHRSFGAVHLDVVGEDTLGGEIQRLAGTLGLGNHITFHGFQPSDRLASIYASAHVNVVSSRHEASNVTVLEAACTGLPTVGTAVGYVADWNPDRAVAVPAGDAAALGNAIAALLGDFDRRRRIGQAARDFAVAHDADWTAAAFDEIYRSLVRR